MSGAPRLASGQTGVSAKSFCDIHLCHDMSLWISPHFVKVVAHVLISDRPIIFGHKLCKQDLIGSSGVLVTFILFVRVIPPLLDI